VLHLFTDCLVSSALLDKYDFPDDGAFLRIFLLTRTSTELYAIVSDFD
jgi:hypothetical protein